MVIQADVDDDEEVKSGKMFLVSSVTELSNSFYTGRERVGGESNLIKSLFELVASEILMRIHYSITLPWCKHANVSEEISKLK